MNGLRTRKGRVSTATRTREVARRAFILTSHCLQTTHVASERALSVLVELILLKHV
jgi:hypothetical protein